MQEPLKAGDERAPRNRPGPGDVPGGEPPGGGVEKTARAALWTSSIASFTTPFMSSGISVALPDIAREFHMSAVTLGWVAGAYLLAAAIFLLPFGRLADIHGRKRFFLAGLVVHSLACLLLAFAPGTAVLLATRVVQGIGGGMIFGTSVAILVSATPPRRRGRVLGINAAAVYLGLTLGPVLGGYLTHAFGWRSIFLLTAVVGLATAGAVSHLLEREWAEARGERFDAWGAVVYSLALTGVMLGFSFLPRPEGIALIGGGIAAFAVFVVLESRTAHALLPMAMFRSNRVFTFSNIAALIHYSATFGVTFLLSLFLQYGKNLDPAAAGTVLMVQSGVMALVSPAAGRLSERFAPRFLSSAGMALITVGLLFLTSIGSGTPVRTIVAILAVLGFGFAVFSSPNTNAVMSSVARKWYGLAGSSLATMRLTGQTLSMGIVLLVFAGRIGRGSIPPGGNEAFFSGVRTVFAVFVVLSVIGVFASMVRGELPPTGEGTA